MGGEGEGGAPHVEGLRLFPTQSDVGRCALGNSAQVNMKKFGVWELFVNPCLMLIVECISILLLCVVWCFWMKISEGKFKDDDHEHGL